MIIQDKFGFNIEIDKEYRRKIALKVPPISILMLRSILRNPDQVMVSKAIPSKRCYYKDIDGKLYKAVVKYVKIHGEHWLNTAHRTDSVREKEVFDENSL